MRTIALLLISLFAVFSLSARDLQSEIDAYFAECDNVPSAFDDVDRTKGMEIPEDLVMQNIVQLQNCRYSPAAVIVPGWRGLCKFRYDGATYYIIERTGMMCDVEWYLFCYASREGYPLLLQIFEGEIDENQSFGSLNFRIAGGKVHLFLIDPSPEFPPLEDVVFEMDTFRMETEEQK